MQCENGLSTSLINTLPRGRAREATTERRALSWLVARPVHPDQQASHRGRQHHHPQGRHDAALPVTDMKYQQSLLG